MPAEIETRGPQILAVTIIFTVLSTVFVTLRMISRIAIVRNVSVDDYFILLAWLIGFGLSFSICYGTSVGLGRHQDDIPPEWDHSLKRSEYSFAVLYNPALMATKTSILIFYLTLSQSHKVFRWATITTLAVVNLAGLALTLLNIVQCRPISAAFETIQPEGAKCTDILALYLSSAPVNIITDLAILVTPMPILTAMRLPKKQKIILIITFGFGIFVTAIDVVRIAFLQQAATNRLRNIQTNMHDSATEARTVELNDFSWYAGLTFLWSAIEVHVGMMCACVPALKPLAARFLPKLLRDDASNDKTLFNDSANRGSLDISSPQSIPSANFEAQEPGFASIVATPQRPAPIITSDSSNQEGFMDMVDFLTTPDMVDAHGLNRTQTALTNSTRHTQPQSPTFFDFVQLKKRKSIVQMTHRESAFPFLMVTLLFFVWGFAYGLLDVLNSQFQEVARMTNSESIGIHSAYFAAYLLGPLTFGRIVLKHWGFKACYIVGLILYAAGTLIFWPSAVLTSFPAFLVSNFIVGLGLSTLEIAANPFIALCGPPRFAEARLNFSQGLQAIGTVVSPLLAKKVLFKADADSLIDVQWTYLGISLFTFLLALAYYYIPLPEATDEELEDASERGDDANHATIFNVRVIWWTLGMGVFSMFCYVGGQEVISTSFSNFLRHTIPRWSTSNGVNQQAIAHSLFATSRFVAAGLGIWIKPRHVLLFFYIGAIALVAASMSGMGITPTALLTAVYFFEGPIFSMIFAMCLRGMGRHTKDAAALLTVAISGGAVFPPINYGVFRAHNTQYAMCVTVAAFAGGATLCLWTELVPSVRRIVDPITDPSLLRQTSNSSEEINSAEAIRNSIYAEKRGSGSFFKGLKHKFEDDRPSPTCEHREPGSWPSDTA